MEVSSGGVSFGNYPVAERRMCHRPQLASRASFEAYKYEWVESFSPLSPGTKFHCHDTKEVP
jgi:hypothetical protein